MGIINYIINKLAGYDVKFKEQQLESSLAAVQKEIDSLRSQITTLQESIYSKQIEVDNKNHELASLKESLESLNAQLNDKEQEIERLTRLLESKDASIAESEYSIAELKSQNNCKQDTILNQGKQIKSLTEENETLNCRIGSVSYNDTESVDLSSEIRDLENQIQKNEETILKQKLRIQQLETEKKEVEKRYKELSVKLSDVQSQRDSLSDQLTKLSLKSPDSSAENTFNWKKIIQYDTSFIDPYNKDRIIFTKSNLWGVADYSGIVIEPKYQEIKTWNKNAYRVKLNNKWGLCKTGNTMLTECRYLLIGDLINSRAEAKKYHPTKMLHIISGYLDEEGNEISTVEIQEDNGLVLRQLFELWGIVSDSGRILIPFKYDDIKPWIRKYYRVKMDGKWGIINADSQKFIISPKYDVIESLIDGIARVEESGKESYIDEEGNEIIQSDVQLQYGLKKTRKSGKWGIIDEYGKEVVEHLYDEIGSFRSRLIGVINNKVIKLNVDYNYPILISGTLSSTSFEHYFFDVAGVNCKLPVAILKQSGMDIGQLCDNRKKCSVLAFGNIFFSKQQYILRILNPQKLSKPLGHADSQNDYVLGELYTGIVSKIMYLTRLNSKRKQKLLLQFEDGRKTMVPRRFFTSNTTIDDYSIGSKLTVKKIGFDEERDQTEWQVLD